MLKNYLVCDSLSGTEDFFDTEDEALAAAEEILDDHRSDCRDAGEWTDEVEHLRVFKVIHSAQICKREKNEEGEECVDYGMLPVSPPTGPLMFAEGRISGLADACDIIRGCMEWTGVSEDDRNFARVLIERIMPTPIIAGD